MIEPEKNDGEKPTTSESVTTSPGGTLEHGDAVALPGEVDESEAARTAATPSDPKEKPANIPNAAEQEHQFAKPVASGAEEALEPGEVEAGARRPADPEAADDVLTRRVPGREAADAEVLRQSRRQTRRSFVLAAAGAAAGYGFYHYVGNGASDDMQPGPLRKAFRFNAAASREVFDEHALAPTYPLSRAENLRVNGVYGLKMPLSASDWRLQLVGTQDARSHSRFTPDVTAWEYKYGELPGYTQDQGHDTKVDPASRTARKMAPEEAMDKAEEDENHTGRKPRGNEEAGESESTLSPGTPGLLLTMDDLLKLPRRELVTQFKCIEGWSQIVQWAGVRMADFLEAYPPAAIGGSTPRYVYMETPDGDYYTGFDLDVMRHPQTLLVTEMMGAPLTQFHGAPLRLHMPTKYGYKQIKRIGLIAYTNDKPDDYWTKLGYDWYAGL